MEETIAPANLSPAANPALGPYDLTGYNGVAGRNFYEEDRILQRIVDRYAAGYDGTHKAELVEHLRGYGLLCGGRLNELTIAAHREGRYGEIVNFDHTGQRIDEVRYCVEQKESRRLSYEYGIVNLDFHQNWRHPFTRLHRMALAYIANMNGEGGVTCPLAMTDGMIRALQELGTPEQKKKYLPLVAGEGSPSHFMAGQYLTERVGGSNVGANRTVARRGENGKWILNGEKWFCSNPGDLWVTTARVEGTNTIGMFLVPRIKDDGELNGCYLVRKKDIIGSRGKVTAEVIYQDLEAEALGRPAHGLANMLRYIIETSRVHVAVAAIGMGTRALFEAKAYTQAREAYGRKIVEFPSVLKTLTEMTITQAAIVLTAFKNFHLMETGHGARQLLTPLMKYASTVHATWITHEAMMLHGGNGILGDFSVLPRLHNDSIINETWEGTHQIIGEHVLKAFARPRIRAAFFEVLDTAVAGADHHAELEFAVAVFRAERARLAEWESADRDWLELNRLAVCDAFYRAFALAEFLFEAVRDLSGKAAAGGALAHFANGYAELIAAGGFTRPTGVFASAAAQRSIVEF